MAIDSEVFRSILAMDSYNHNYDAGIIISGNQIGTATLGIDSMQALGLQQTQAVQR